jgi:hypothetical protein
VPPLARLPANLVRRLQRGLLLVPWLERGGGVHGRVEVHWWWGLGWEGSRGAWGVGRVASLGQSSAPQHTPADTEEEEQSIRARSLIYRLKNRCPSRRERRAPHSTVSPLAKDPSSLRFSLVAPM